jgi:ribosome-associated protein
VGVITIRALPEHYSKRCYLDTLDLARSIVDVLEDKKGEDIVLMEIRDISDFADYFVICTGTSDRMLQALADGVTEQLRSKHKVRGKIEGDPGDGWVLVDFGDVILHLFSEDRREYYRLEDLWSKGKVLLRLQ